MKKLSNYVFVRHRHNWIQLFKFGMVGGSGVLVNLLVTIICNKLFPPYLGVAIDLPFTDFNIRWYHVITTVAFLFANTWNFQLNRSWTFKSARHANWFKEFFPFLAVGLVAFVGNQVVLTLLLKDGSPLSLHRLDFFDDSTGFRTALYWAQLVAVCVTMPINYVVNKLWTFRAVRSRRKHPDAELPMVASAVAPEVVDEQGRPRPNGVNGVRPKSRAADRLSRDKD